MSGGPLGIIVAGALGSFGGGGANKKSTRKIGPIVAGITVRERHTDTLEITEHPVEQGAAISDHVYKRPASVVIEVSWSNSVAKPQSLVGSLTSALVNRIIGQAVNGITSAASKAIGGSAIGNLAVGKLQSAVSGIGTSLGLQTNTGTGKGTSVIQDVYQSLLKLQDSHTLIDIYTGKRVYKNMLIKTITTESDVLSENALPVTLECVQVLIVKTTVVSVSAPASAQAAPEKTAPPQDTGAKQTQPVEMTDVQRQVALQNAFYAQSKYSN